MKTISAEWQLCSLEEVYPDPHCSLLYLQFRGWESTTVHHVAATVLHGVKGKVKYFLHLVTSLIYAPCLASIDTWLRSPGLDDSPHPTWCLSPYIPSSVMRSHRELTLPETASSIVGHLWTIQSSYYWTETYLPVVSTSPSATLGAIQHTEH